MTYSFGPDAFRPHRTTYHPYSEGDRPFRMPSYRRRTEDEEINRLFNEERNAIHRSVDLAPEDYSQFDNEAISKKGVYIPLHKRGVKQLKKVQESPKQLAAIAALATATAGLLYVRNNLNVTTKLAPLATSALMSLFLYNSTANEVKSMPSFDNPEALIKLRKDCSQAFVKRLVYLELSRLMNSKDVNKVETTTYMLSAYKTEEGPIDDFLKSLEDATGIKDHKKLIELVKQYRLLTPMTPSGKLPDITPDETIFYKIAEKLILRAVTLRKEYGETVLTERNKNIEPKFVKEMIDLNNKYVKSEISRLEKKYALGKITEDERKTAIEKLTNFESEMKDQFNQLNESTEEEMRKFNNEKLICEALLSDCVQLTFKYYDTFMSRTGKKWVDSEAKSSIIGSIASGVGTIVSGVGTVGSGVVISTFSTLGTGVSSGVAGLRSAYGTIFGSSSSTTPNQGEISDKLEQILDEGLKNSENLEKKRKAELEKEGSTSLGSLTREEKPGVVPPSDLRDGQNPKIEGALSALGQTDKANDPSKTSTDDEINKLAAERKNQLAADVIHLGADEPNNNNNRQNGTPGEKYPWAF